MSLHPRRKRRLGKKGFIAGALVDIWAYILFLVIVIVFYIVFKVTAQSSIDKMRGSADIFAGNIYSAAYLRMPVTVEGNEMTMADLIRLADVNGAYESAFKKNTTWFWEKTFPKDVCFFIHVKGTALDYEAQQSSCTNIATDSAMKVWVETSHIPLLRFRTLLPPFEAGKDNIEVYFYFDLDALRSAYGLQGPYINYREHVDV